MNKSESRILFVTFDEVCHQMTHRVTCQEPVICGSPLQKSILEHCTSVNNAVPRVILAAVVMDLQRAVKAVSIKPGVIGGNVMQSTMAALWSCRFPDLIFSGSAMLLSFSACLLIFKSTQVSYTGQGI